jgi:hypothetical protein
MGESIKSIMEEANRQEVVFEGMDQLNEFLQLVTELSNNSRLWVNGGHTPREMFEKYDKPNLRPLPKEPFMTNPQQVRSDKVGRNEPCPCGSGKKYKKCAVELAKAYGGTDGHKYVNGVLDRLAAESRAVEVQGDRRMPPSPRSK